MVLVDWQIREAIEKGWIKVDPFSEGLINPASLDVRLGGNFAKIECTKICVNPMDKSTFKVVEYANEDWFMLQPGEAITASLLEDITLSDSLCAKLYGKSSLARLGLDNSSIGAWVDNGWSGVLTIELFNQAAYPILLTRGMKIGQLVFFETEVCNKPYGEVGRYQRQKRGQGSLGL